VEPSQEIRRILERWLVAAREGDADTFIGKISEHAGVLVVGTDEEEWWHRNDAAVWKRQLEEAGGFPFSWVEIETWEEGTVGWAGAELTLTGPEQTFPIRLTWVLHLEQGEWKIVQMHFSAGRPNVELLGRELPVSLDQLEQTIRRERPDLTDTLAADGTVTIVFTDIVDSTVLTGRLGDHAWLDALRRHNEVIGEAAAAHGGTVVETQGDGSMLAFSSARRAVACGQAIQAEIDRAFSDAAAPIRVRIGIHTGDALREADHFYGTTVHHAARVAGSALGGEVLVSNLVRELVAGSGVHFRESREVELKGLEGSHRLFAVELG
jgi:class 3 adenylate cyclase/ketosteroid isomerase-like protein